jgi:superfamily II DNA/RNA helicase
VWCPRSAAPHPSVAHQIATVAASPVVRRVRAGKASWGDVALSVVTKFKRPARTELFWAVGRGERLRLSAELVSLAGRAVVFCRNVPEAIRVASDLSRLGVPAASVEHRDFSSSRVRARVVTDETALSVGRDSTACIIQFDPALTSRRYRRRVDLVATTGATVVSFVVPEREGEMRRLLRSLDLPDVLTGPDMPAVADALREPPVTVDASEHGDGEGDSSRARQALAAARSVARQVPRGASRAGLAVGRGVQRIRHRHPDGSEEADGS